MFHLFMNILLYPDLYAGTNNNNIIFTKLTDYQYDNLDVAKSLFNTGYCEIYNQSYSNIIGKDKLFETDVDFFKYLADNKVKEFRLYADCQSFAIIVCKYFKLFLPNLDQNQAYLHYKLSLDYFYLYYKYFRYENKSLTLYNPNKLTKDTYARLDKDQFIDLFNKTIVTGDVSALGDDFNQYLSTEYKIASYFVNDISDVVKSTLLSSLQEIIAKNLQTWYHDIQYSTFMRLYRNRNYQDDICELIGDGDVAYVANQLKMHKFDTLISSIKQARQDDKNVISTAEHVIFYMDNVQDESKIELQINKAIQLLQSDDIKDYLDVLINSYKKTNAFPSIQNRVDSLNLYLCEYIFDLYNNNELGKLKQFKI